jgi:hypothetical protein
MVFPFENEIKWDSIIIRSNTQNGMLSKINHWWKTKNNEELIKIQKQCKTILRPICRQPDSEIKCMNF